jgi:MinD superfamily P-loop ATPase
LSIEKFCSKERIQLIGYIPFDSEVTRAMVNGYPVVKYSTTSPASEAIKKMYERLSLILELYDG